MIHSGRLWDIGRIHAIIVVRLNGVVKFAWVKFLNLEPVTLNQGCSRYHFDLMPLWKLWRFLIDLDSSYLILYVELTNCNLFNYLWDWRWYLFWSDQLYSLYKVLNLYNFFIQIWRSWTSLRWSSIRWNFTSCNWWFSFIWKILVRSKYCHSWFLKF